jgi:hypothetical protein
MSKEISKKEEPAEPNASAAEPKTQSPIEPPSVLEIVPIVPPVSSIPASPVKETAKSSGTVTPAKLAPLVQPEIVQTPKSAIKLIDSDVGGELVVSTAGGSSPYRSSIAPRQTVISRRANNSNAVMQHGGSEIQYKTIVSTPISLRTPNNAVGQVFR